MAGLIVMTGQILRFKVLVVAQRSPSVARTTMDVPFTPAVAAVGMPLSTPALFKVSPDGSVPEASVQV